MSYLPCFAAPSFPDLPLTRGTRMMGGMCDFLDQLSPGLFWDTRRENIDPERHARAIIQRVVERGTLAEWKVTRKHYGDEKMRSVVTSLRWLSPRDVAFCCVAFGLTKEDFRCCTSRPFPEAPWIY